MPTKIIDTASYTAWPRSPVRDGNGDLVFVYWDGAGALTTFSIYEARSTDDGATWVSSLINFDDAVWCLTGAFGVTSVGTLLVATSAYKLPYPSTPNNAPRVWRKTTAGVWTRAGDLPQPAGDSIFVPFGRTVQLTGGVIRITCCGWDAARTYAHIYYVDSSDDGVTWGNLTTIYQGANSANELCYYAEGNNHLVITRREDEYGTHEGGMRQFVSTSAGASGTWVDMGEVPAIVGRYAAAPDIMSIGNGRIALLYGDRGDIAYYGSEQQHSMRMVVGNFSDILTSVNKWSNSITFALTYPETNADSGYGGLYKTSDAATLLQVIYHDGSQTDCDIWHESIDTTSLVGNIKRIICDHNETGKTVYAIVRREVDGYFLSGFTGIFEACPAYYYTYLAEHQIIKGRYEVAETRSAWDDGRYTVAIYKQAGTDPLPASDTIIGTGEMKIKNDIEVEEITLSEIEASTVLAKEGTLEFLEKWVLNKLVEAPTGTWKLYDDDGLTVLRTWVWDSATKTRAKAV